MPIYEYECSLCGHRLDEFQKMSDESLKDCPKCNKPGLHKLVSAAGFQLKGTGWYATDFRNKGKPETKPASSEGGSTESKETKTDSGKES